MQPRQRQKQLSAYAQKSSITSMPHASQSLCMVTLLLLHNQAPDSLHSTKTAPFHGEWTCGTTSAHSAPTCENSAAVHAAQRHVQACSSPPRQASKSCAVGHWRQRCNTHRKHMMCVASLRRWRAAQSCSRKECSVCHHPPKAHPSLVHPAQHKHDRHPSAAATGTAAAAQGTSTERRSDRRPT
jgi:hypothetical protein